MYHGPKLLIGRSGCVHLEDHQIGQLLVYPPANKQCMLQSVSSLFITKTTSFGVNLIYVKSLNRELQRIPSFTIISICMLKIRFKNEASQKIHSNNFSFTVNMGKTEHWIRIMNENVVWTIVSKPQYSNFDTGKTIDWHCTQKDGHASHHANSIYLMYIPQKITLNWPSKTTAFLT